LSVKNFVGGTQHWQSQWHAREYPEIVCGWRLIG
jgi:hypothetical protein